MAALSSALAAIASAPLSKGLQEKLAYKAVELYFKHCGEVKKDVESQPVDALATWFAEEQVPYSAAARKDESEGEYGEYHNTYTQQTYLVNADAAKLREAAGDSMASSAGMASGPASLALSESTCSRALTSGTLLSAGVSLTLDSVKLHTGGSACSSPTSQVPTSCGSDELAPEISSDEECWECDSGDTCTGSCQWGRSYSSFSEEAEMMCEMMEAIDSGAAPLVQRLVGSGADPFDTTPEGEFTYLMIAAEGGHLDIVRYFVETCHLEVDARDGLGSTALELAAEGGQLEVVRYLLSQGADVRNRAIDGSTALQGARRGGHEEIVRHLAAEWKSTASKQGVAFEQFSSELAT